MEPHPPPLEYAASASAGTGVRRVEVRETPDGLTITIPPRPLWVVALPRGVVLVGTSALLVCMVWHVWRHGWQNGVNICSVLGVLLIAAIAVTALLGLVEAARVGNMATVIQVSPGGLVLEDPASALDRRPTRRWRAEEIGYVYVQRSALTATLGFNVNISVIRPGTGSMEHVCSLNSREPDLHRRLELLINRHLRAGGGDAAVAVMPVIPAMPAPSKPDARAD